MSTWQHRWLCPKNRGSAHHRKTISAKSSAKGEEDDRWTWEVWEVCLEFFFLLDHSLYSCSFNLELQYFNAQAFALKTDLCLGTWFRATERLVRSFRGWTSSTQSSPSTSTCQWQNQSMYSQTFLYDCRCTPIFTTTSTMLLSCDYRRFGWTPRQAVIPKLILRLLCKTI